VYSALAVGGCMALVALAVINNPQSTFGYASRIATRYPAGSCPASRSGASGVPKPPNKPSSGTCARYGSSDPG
jgi:hypothetical protein